MGLTGTTQSVITRSKNMVPDLLAGYSFLAAVTAKDNVTGLPSMIAKTVERMTGLAFDFTPGPQGFPSRLNLRWTGGPTIARGLGEYVSNLMANPDTYIAALAAIGPGFIRSYSPIGAPSKLSSVINLIEDAGAKSLIAIVAGTIWDPPPGVDTTSNQATQNPRRPVHQLRGASAMKYSVSRPYATAGPIQQAGVPAFFGSYW